VPIVFLTIKRFAAWHAGLRGGRRHVDIARALRLAEARTHSFRVRLRPISRPIPTTTRGGTARQGEGNDGTVV